MAISLAWALPVATIMPMRTLLFGLGILLMLAGVMLRWCAIRTLGASFRRDLAVRADHTVVDPISTDTSAIPRTAARC